MALNFFKVRNGLNVGVATSDPSGGTTGDMYYNSTSNKLREFVNGSWRDAVTADDTQTLSNKTLDNTTVETIKDSNLTVQNASDTTKQAKLDASGITTGTTRTYILPDASTTLVGTGVTQTLSNKTLDNTTVETIKDSNLTVQNSSDTTKQFKFDASGITTGNTRTLTAPDVSSTLLARTSSDTGANRVQNKDLDAGSTKIVDPTDTTKKIAFQASGATTATTLTLSESQSTSQTLAIPNVSSGDSIVTNNTTATVANKQIQFSSTTDSSTTGTAATLGAFTTGIVRLTNASLTSVSGIPAGSSGQYLLVENKTGNTLTFNNEDTGVTAGTRIKTGTGAGVSIQTDATLIFAYDSTSSRWQLAGGAGAGSGSGSKNYLSQITTSNGNNNGNGNFESGTTTGWSLAHSALTSLFPTSTASAGTAFDSTHGGSSANANLTLTATNTGNIAGSYSAHLSQTSAGSTAGDMLISNQFFIDDEDAAKVLTFKLYYYANNGTLNFSGTSSNSFAIYIYDVTNGAWIQPAGVYGMTTGVNSNGIIGYATGTFQTTSNSTGYQIAIININAAATVYDIYFDDISVGPQTAPIGVPVSDWINAGPNTISATTTAPTKGTATITNDNLWWRRVGGNMEIRMEYSQTAAGTATAGSGDYLFQIPSGYSIDLNKVAEYTTVNGSRATNVVGSFFAEGGASNLIGYVVVYDGTHVRYQGNSGNGTTSPDFGTVGSADNGLTNASLNYAATYSVPIAGWSSNVQMSSDTDTRVVAATVSGTSTTVTSSVTTLVPTTITNDTHSGFSGSTYTVPVSGFYLISMSYFVNSSFGSGAYIEAYVQHNATNILVGGEGSQAAGGEDLFPGGSVLRLCNAGDTLKFAGQTSGGSVAASNLVGNIFRLSGPSVIASTETVAMHYTDTSGGAIGTGSATYTYATKDYDTHNAYSSGTYTVPVSGKYLIKGSIGTASVSISTTQTLNVYVYQNGVSKAQAWIVGSGGTTNYFAQCMTTLNCVTGDLITIRVSSPGGATTANTAVASNEVFITRVGN